MLYFGYHMETRSILAHRYARSQPIRTGKVSTKMQGSPKLTTHLSSHVRVSPLTLFLVVLAALSIWYWSGLNAVPFHPDESTQIYMSADVERMLQDPSSLFWRAHQANEKQQRYRALDAPLTRLSIGLARIFTGQPPLSVDWNWGTTWEENRASGALPVPSLLQTARLATAMWFPFTVLFLYLAARRAYGEPTAWIAALLLATNALVLLHTRRAMAEGPLLFTLTFALWSLVTAEKRPWLAAFPTVLAFCAKQTLAALLPIALLALLWQPGKPLLHRLRDTALSGLIYLAVVVLLNPFLWSDPVGAIRYAVQERQELAHAQTADRPTQALNTPGRKLIGMVGSLYLTPPIFAETINYANETRTAEEAYLRNPLHTVGRSIPVGGILMLLGVMGLGWSAARTARPRATETGATSRRALALLTSAGIVLALALLVAIPLPWQRYYMPLVPFTCLWAAAGIMAVIDRMRVAALKKPVTSSR